ncbi:MAG: glycosyltransferase [Endomicrobium sp.]|jgi:glycosyltransferase involved in cell wall biosynthesis|nr:glycosyltransferase [Endomicrobium sp.]
MNIAYIITGLGIGGAERVTIDIANRISKLSNNVIILYLTGENLHKTDIDASVKTYALNMKKTPWSFIGAIFRTRKILKSFSPDVVHGQMFHANIFARILKIFYRIPKLISTEHTIYIGINFRMFIYRITDFLSDINSNVSETATNYFVEKKAFSKSKSLTVYNGIDLSKFRFNNTVRKDIRNRYNIKEDDFVFLNVGRLILQKDHKNLLRSFSFLIKAGSKAKLIIVGLGELVNELKEYACEKKIEDYVIFTGIRNNVEDYYSVADCFVLSSSFEGFGIVIVEAMAVGLPVITTEAGGACGEILQNKEFVVPIKNSEALFAKMKYILKNPQQKFKVGNENKEKSKRFDVELISNQWFDIYKM